MKKANEFESGVLSILPEGGALSPDALVRTCHEILDATAVLLINVAQLASSEADPNERQSVVDDALESIARIAKVAQAVQAAARAEHRGPGFASSRPAAQATAMTGGRRRSR